MKRSCLSIICAFVLLSHNAESEDRIVNPVEEAQRSLTGAWNHHGLYYQFDTKGIMTVAQLDGDRKGYKTFKFTIEQQDNRILIRYGKDLRDSRNTDFLLLYSINDTTAVIAVGTPFARTDSSDGLTGVWKHVKNFKTILLTFGDETIDYQQAYLDTQTGEMKQSEVRKGTWRREEKKNSGSMTIRFDDGTHTVVVPLLFDDFMYLFDLAPRKSLFLKTDKAPTYREYQKITAQ